jgi:cysteine desulfurase
VLNSLRNLEDEGYSVTYLPLQKNGILSLEDLEAAIRPDTLAASIMMVNNEIGTLQNMEEIGRILRQRKVYFHSDIAQSFGKLPIDVNKFNLDIASISSHKVGSVNPDLRS